MIKSQRLAMIDKLLAEWIAGKKKEYLRLALREAVIEYENDYNVKLDIKIVERSLIN